jgi:flagellar biosynthetic protein FliO
MTTIARLLGILALTLPLGAGAAQAPAPAPATPAQPAAEAPAAAASATSTLASVPAADTPAAAAPGTAAPAAGAPAAAAPETTVGGGAANRAPADGHPAGMPAAMPASPATGSLLQTLFALIVVLGVLGALAWFLKRYGPRVGGGSANLRVVGSLSLGGRERLLVVEVGGQWIVVGASPGRVNALATMPKQEGIDAGSATLAQNGANAAPTAGSFGDWLKQTIDKRK